MMNFKKERLLSAMWLSGLIRQTGIGLATAEKILVQVGDLTEIVKINPKSILELISGPPEKVYKAGKYIKNKEIMEQLAVCAKQQSENGIQVFTILDTDYPERLRMISSHPVVLYYVGENSKKIFEQKYFSAVVGTRKPTPYGTAATYRIVSGLVSRQVVIISGLARGIDSLAHQITIEKGGFTIAVLGCGINVIYPPENKELMNRIVEKGMIISECPPDVKPIKSYFPARNRIISGLADSVAIIEASRKSGTMITAGYAADQGKDLYAVPGSIFSPSSQGTNRLIQDGACVLSEAEDMLWRLPLPYSIAEYEEKSEGEELSDRLMKVLLYTEKTMDEIAFLLNIPVEKAAELISLEEIKGKICYNEGRIVLTDSFK
jgi:DNA processing protein